MLSMSTTIVIRLASSRNPAQGRVFHKTQLNDLARDHWRERVPAWK